MDSDHSWKEFKTCTYFSLIWLARYLLRSCFHWETFTWLSSLDIIPVFLHCFNYHGRTYNICSYSFLELVFFFLSPTSRIQTQKYCFTLVVHKYQKTNYTQQKLSIVGMVIKKRPQRDAQLLFLKCKSWSFILWRIISTDSKGKS